MRTRNYEWHEIRDMEIRKGYDPMYAGWLAEQVMMIQDFGYAVVPKREEDAAPPPEIA